ncbi:uncharacterized protein LOC103497401 [Cucumis melo]|nr:uncharacterized protein LOC103497401 [Cucumis melo]
MGVCASTQTPITRNPKCGIKFSKQQQQQQQQHQLLNLDSIKVIHMDGFIEEFSDPIKASKITSRNPNFFLCNSEQMLIGSCVPSLSSDENLQIGQIYFLLPLSLAHSPLSLPDLCNFAIKASSALRNIPSPFFR